MLTVSFETEEQKVSLIEQYSLTHELVETRYLFNGNELKFKEKVNGMTVDERLGEVEQAVNFIIIGGI